MNTNNQSNQKKPKESLEFIIRAHNRTDTKKLINIERAQSMLTKICVCRAEPTLKALKALKPMKASNALVEIYPEN